MVPPLKPLVRVDITRVRRETNGLLEAIAEALRARGNKSAAAAVLDLRVTEEKAKAVGASR